MLFDSCYGIDNYSSFIQWLLEVKGCSCETCQDVWLDNKEFRQMYDKLNVEQFNDYLDKLKWV